MTKTKIAALAAISLAMPSVALAEITPGAILGTSDADITAALAAQGYVIDEIDREDDELEIDAMLDGIEYEFKLDPATGEVLEVEAEDADDEDDENDEDDTQKG